MVLSARHGEHLTSTSRIDVPTSADERLRTGSCSTLQPAPPVPHPGLTVQPRMTVGGPLPGKPLSATEFHFLSELECEGRSVEAGPEGGGDANSEKCPAWTHQGNSSRRVSSTMSIVDTRAPRRSI